MSAVTIQQLDNAALDVAHISDVATSTSATSTDRLGNVKRTVKNAVDSLAAFNSRGAWVTGTVYAVKDLMTNGGTWYACVTAHTASAAFATDTAKWRVHQGITAGELSATSGATLVGSTGGTWTTIQGAINKLISILGAATIGYQSPDAGAQAQSVGSELDANVINVFRFMTAAQIADVRAGTFTLDVTTPINLGLSACAAFGGKLRMPWGGYKTTSMLLVPSAVSIIGDGQIKGSDASRQGVTSIRGVHTGVAILSLKGAIGCTIADLSLEAGSGAIPKTGLMLGRSSAASAGYHHIERVAVYGYFSVAPIYSIASEDNVWTDIKVNLYGGGAKYCLYTSRSDSLSTGAGLTASSNLDNVFYRPFFINYSTDANSACIFIQAAQDVGSWSFFGGYLTPYAGAYVHIDSGTIDGLSALGPFTFVGVSGELHGDPSADPIWGLRLTSTGTMTLSGLTYIGARFAFQAGANHYQILQPGNLFLDSPNIQIKPPEAFPYALCSLQRQLIKNGNVIVGRQSEWVAPTLAGSWLNYAGAPAAPVSYSVDGFGVVHVRGSVQGGAGTIFTLPADYWPVDDMYFMAYAGGGVGKLKVAAATGIVSLVSGSNTEVILSSVKFKVGQ